MKMLGRRLVAHKNGESGLHLQFGECLVAIWFLRLFNLLSDPLGATQLQQFDALALGQLDAVEHVQWFAGSLCTHGFFFGNAAQCVQNCVPGSAS